MLSFTYLFINFIVTVIVLLFVLVFHNVQNGFGYKEIMMEVKRMRGGVPCRLRVHFLDSGNQLVCNERHFRIVR